MRFLPDVVDELLAAIPLNDPKRAEFATRAAKITNSFRYTAPEAVKYRWRDLGGVLQSLYPDGPVADELRGIFNNNDAA